MLLSSIAKQSRGSKQQEIPTAVLFELLLKTRTSSGSNENIDRKSSEQIFDTMFRDNLKASDYIVEGGSLL
ncbi:hypothetical protein RRG08_013046 [Elysia crispata]|uniref:Uncharacterized protein n=1 Tax=Elysia crispata TaxID=231223 RepID=A0AAE1A199_9GAST|nr:hypothetical protein RRG08_013046 [Elysia crispata]